MAEAAVSAAVDAATAALGSAALAEEGGEAEGAATAVKVAWEIWGATGAGYGS